jgi:hypothetical protein
MANKKQPDKRKTWFIDFDGTLVLQKSHLGDKDYILDGTLDFFKNVVKENDYVIITTGRNSEEHKERIAKFLNQNGIKYDLIICDLPTGPRVIINDKKPDGTITAYSVNLTRDEGIKTSDFNFGENN